MDGTYRISSLAMLHAARLVAGGVETLCGRGYPFDERFTRGPVPHRQIACKLCRSALAKEPPKFVAGAWSGPSVYCTREELVATGLLKQINTLLAPLSLFAELQGDDTLRVLDYRHLPDQAAAIADVVQRTKRQNLSNP